jgi:hypothetical protein
VGPGNLARSAESIQHNPGGWNRVGGKQVILDDPSGNPIELFEPLLPEARVG